MWTKLQMQHWYDFPIVRNYRNRTYKNGLTMMYMIYMLIYMFDHDIWLLFFILTIFCQKQCIINTLLGILLVPYVGSKKYACYTHTLYKVNDHKVWKKEIKSTKWIYTWWCNKKHHKLAFSDVGLRPIVRMRDLDQWGRVLSMAVVLRDPRPYLFQFWRKLRKTPNG